MTLGILVWLITQVLTPVRDKGLEIIFELCQPLSLKVKKKFLNLEPLEFIGIDKILSLITGIN